MSQLKDSSDDFLIGALLTAVALGVGLTAMFNSMDDDIASPEPPAQVRNADPSSVPAPVR